MPAITLPTGRTIDSSQFEWRDAPLAPDSNGGYTRPYAVLYGGHDFADYLTPEQLRMIPGADVARINFHFYALHQIEQGKPVRYDVDDSTLELFVENVMDDVAGRALAAAKFAADPTKQLRDVGMLALGVFVIWRILR